MNEGLLNLLVIDDDTIDRMAVKRALKNLPDIHIHEAIDTSSGLALLKSTPVDCVFLDYLLPDGDGLGFLKKMRAENIFTPVIMLTGQGDERLAVQIIQAGASDYLPKSQVSPEMLTHSLQQALRIYQLQQQSEQARQELIASNKRIVDILESISDAFFATDNNWKITYINQQAEDLLQVSRSGILDSNLWDALPTVESWFKRSLETALENKTAVASQGYYPPVAKWFEIKIYPGNEGVSVYFKDITDRKQDEERLNYLACHDSLTGLANRSLLLNKLEHALKRACGYQTKIAVLFCDLDRFKQVNDNLGHAQGDKLLKIVARRLEREVRTNSGDTVARLGGDEFVIVLTDIVNIENVIPLANRVINCVQEPISLDEIEIQISMSVGISLFPKDGHEAEQLLKKSDMAMYKAKEVGRNNFLFYSELIDHTNIKKLQIETALRNALANHEFKLHYQPLISFKTRTCIGAEALIRWQNPLATNINPLEMLELATEMGIILPIGNWVIRTACQQLKKWHQAGYSYLKMCINLSDQEFKNPHLPDNLKALLEELNLNACAIELELTENIMMKDVSNARKKIDELLNLEVHLALDDFGTGFSSLVHLKEFPLHTIKIDRTFTKDIINNPNNLIIIEALVDMCHKLDKEVVVEGVETQAQVELLEQAGCDIAQGFFYGRPMPAEEFDLFLNHPNIGVSHEEID